MLSHSLWFNFGSKGENARRRMIDRDESAVDDSGVNACIRLGCDMAQ